MNDMIETTMQTPIEVALGIDENGMTTARALYSFLEMPSQNFARWAKTNIENNEFYEENKDWWGFFTMKNGNECKDYKLTTDFAKHLSMESHSSKGKIARQYFIKVEDGMKELATRFQNMSPELRAVLVVDQRVTRVEKKADTLEERFNEFEQTLPLLPEDADDVSKEVKKRVVEVLGGKDSNAYHDKSLSQTVFKDAYRDLKRNFDVNSYKAIKRQRKGAAIELARAYQAPLYLQERIRYTNAQMSFGGNPYV